MRCTVGSQGLGPRPLRRKKIKPAPRALTLDLRATTQAAIMRICPRWHENNDSPSTTLKRHEEMTHECEGSLCICNRTW
jgi:hypothetical protein